MTLHTPPPLPLRALPVDPPQPRVRAAARGDSGGSRLGLVMMFLLCSGLPILAATCFVWHRDAASGGGGPLAGGFFYLLAYLFVYLLALLTGLINCWHCVGGLVVAAAFACSGRVTRTSFWVMRAGYGLLSGFLLLELANAGIGPAVRPLAWPIAGDVATWVVPAVGLFPAVGIRWLERRRPR
jgi:hypothetical protein